MTISRREMLQRTAAAAAAAASLPLANAVPSPESLLPKPKFFTPAEFAVVDELSDLIIPTDAQSGGARAAGVTTYIDARLAEAFEKAPQEEWRAGIKAVEDLSREMNGGTGFMAATAEQRLAVLTRMAAGESDPKTPAEKFFKQIKSRTIDAYYTSKIGIHDDQKYKGNVYQTGDYAGFDAT